MKHGNCSFSFLFLMYSTVLTGPVVGGWVVGAVDPRVVLLGAHPQAQSLEEPHHHGDR